MEALVEPLMARGFEVLALDAPGHRESAGRLRHASDYVGAILSVERAFGAFDAVIGHSLGGAAATQAALRGHLETRRLVTVGASLELELYVFRDRPSRGKGIRSWLGFPLHRLGSWILGAAGMASWEDFSLERRRRENQAKILVVHDREDRIVAFRHAEELFQRIERAHLLSTSGLGHNRILRDEATVERISSFWEKHPGRPMGAPAPAMTG